MEQYFLFLDETKPNTYIEHFCFGGCIIKQSDYEDDIIPRIKKIKRDTFGSGSVILHEIDIRNAKEDPYRIFRDRLVRESFWASMHDLFDKTQSIHVLCVAINDHRYRSFYTSEFKNDVFLIALQILLENFVHFLESLNGIGSVLIESRNPKDDQKLQNHYHTIKANGTLFFGRNAFQKRLGTISFLLKTDNNIGLQLADFIPNPVARSCGSMVQKKYSLINPLLKRLYDGGVGLPDRFGLKIVP